MNGRLRLDLSAIDHMTAAEIAEHALSVQEPSTFWYLAGLFTGKLSDNTLHRALALQMRNAAHARPFDEAKARDLLANFLKYRRPADDIPESPS